MLRNKEMSYCLILFATITILGALIGSSISWLVSILVILVAIALGAVFIYYTKKRYNDIAQLSAYLRDIMNGSYRIDVRDNQEGELSILRNEIFKWTERQNEQHLYLKEDREQMAEALADISHQLKTPLASIQVMLDLLDNPSLPQHRKEEFTANIQKQLDRMDWLVKSLLKLSKLDAGTVTFQKQSISLSQLIQSALSTLEIPLEVKNITVNITSHDPLKIVADEKWTQEAILNVLKNAVEHTPPNGFIDISWSEHPIVTSLTIKNSGSVIIKEDLPYIFKRFYRGKHASDSSVGIGLALSLQIMEAQNGQIEVQSSEELGTSFTFKWFKIPHLK